MKYYLSEPMTNIAAFNFPAFADAAEKMRALGLDVLSAHEIKHSDGAEWADYLRSDLIEMLKTCHAIVVLPGWQSSKGARLELHVAQELSMQVFFWNNDRLEQQTATQINAEFRITHEPQINS